MNFLGEVIGVTPYQSQETAHFSSSVCFAWSTLMVSLLTEAGCVMFIHCKNYGVHSTLKLLHTTGVLLLLVCTTHYCCNWCV